MRAATIVLVAAFATTPAAASERFALDWDAPAACPDANHVAAAIRNWLESPRVEPAQEPLVRVDATVRPSPDGWELELTLAAPGGSEHQTVVAARCETLANLVALKVALATDPATTMRTLDVAGEAPETQAATAFGVRGVLGGGVGPVPGASAFASIVGSMQRPGWSLEVAGAAWLPQSATYVSPPGVGANVLLVTGSTRACLTGAALTAAPNVRLVGCAGAELGVLRGSGVGFSQAETSSQPWLAAVAGVAARWPLASSLSLWVGVDASLGIVRPSFYVRGLGEIFRPDPVGARGWLGLEHPL